MIAKLGIGNAHPGGFAATIQQLERHPIPKHSRVLEVGCGTGRTSCYLAAQGHEVTGVDIRADMIHKARERAKGESLSVHFEQGDATALSFPDDAFDVVLVESVTVFTDSRKALTEYNRVLRSGGKLYDREMVRLTPLSTEMNQEIIDFYQIRNLWTPEDWLEAANAVHFSQVHIEGPFHFPELNEDLTQYPDHHQHMDSGALLDPSVWEVIRHYNDIMNRYRSSVGYILLTASK